MPELADVARTAGFGLGAVAAVAGLAHQIAVTMVAYSERGGYDLRLATLLAIGILPITLGIAMVWGAAVAAEEPMQGFTIVAGASGLFSLVIIILWPGLTTGPSGSLAGTAIGLVAFAAETVLAWLSR